MDIEKLYEQIGGNYNLLIKRLPSKQLIEKFVIKFLDDKCFYSLSEMLNIGNREEAFRSVHTLKGVCANLEFCNLFKVCSELTENIRSENSVIDSNTFELFEKVKKEYEHTIACIKDYKNQK